MSPDRIKSILAIHNISMDFFDEDIDRKNLGVFTRHLWENIRDKNDPLTEREHIEIFDFCWALGNQIRGSSVNISERLKLKCIENRHRIEYDMVLSGDIEDSVIISLKIGGNIKGIDEVEVWSLFHKLRHHDSARDSDEINGILGTYKIIKHKLKWFGKINVLDVGCGKNGNGVSTLAAKYSNKIRGFGIDLDIQDHPSNVTLVKASAKRIPFNDNFFDVIYSCHVINYLGNDKIANILKEILRVLKHTGYFIFNDYQRSWKTYRNEIVPRTSINARVISKNPIIIVKY